MATARQGCQEAAQQRAGQTQQEPKTDDRFDQRPDPRQRQNGPDLGAGQGCRQVEASHRTQRDEAEENGRRSTRPSGPQAGGFLIIEDPRHPLIQVHGRTFATIGGGDKVGGIDAFNGHIGTFDAGSLGRDLRENFIPPNHQP
ncbi:MAG: hypothetical protein LW626_11655 [Verrucomicrobium sp.]|nr:hypothetical protein [Verrucomicrobium sp.]